MMFVYDLDPGGSSSPYHYEYEEELASVVDGTFALRAADGEHTLQRGDLVRFRPTKGAHKVMNRATRRRDTGVLQLARAGGLRLP
jgi:uncharacterized cupin superfamily protein